MVTYPAGSVRPELSVDWSWLVVISECEEPQRYSKLCDHVKSVGDMLHLPFYVVHLL